MNTKRRSLWFAALWVYTSGVMAPTSARAGGFEYGTDNGAEALARGGATTARASLSAAYSNIAGIADTPRADIFLSANLVFRDISFQREGFREIADETPLFPGPMLMAHIRLTDRLVLGFGVHGPAAVGEGHFDQGDAENPGPTRYLMTDMSLIYAIPTIALAFSLPQVDGLRLAVAFQPGVARAELSVYANALEVDNSLFDVRADALVWDWFVPAIQIGFLQRIGDRIEIGGQVRLTDSVRAEGEARPTAFPYNDDLRQTTEPSRARLDVPLPFATIRLGIRYRHPRPGAAAAIEEDRPLVPHRVELFDIELDVVYESNSDFDEFVVYPLEPIQLPSPFGEVAIDELPVRQQWRDTVNVRLGGTVNLLGGDLSLSGGVFYQSAATPEAYTHLVFASWTGVGLSLGVTYRLSWFEVGVGYVHIFMPDREVSADEGQVFPLRAAPGGGTFDSPAANAGLFRADYDILAITLAARLEPRRRDRRGERDAP